MKEIKLLVKDENIETILHILNNLKSGLISEIQTEQTKKPLKKTHYQPKKSGVIFEQESGTNDTSGKYSANAYRERLKKGKS